MITLIPSGLTGYLEIFDVPGSIAYLPEANYRLNIIDVFTITQSTQNTLFVDGDLISEIGSGVVVNDSSRSLIKVGSTGLVSGANGIYVHSSLIRIENTGEIIANAYETTGASIFLAPDSETITIHNAGTMSGGGYGVLSQARDVSLTNSGTVSGLGTGVAATGNLNVYNEGLIAGNTGIGSTAGVGSVATIVNDGTIRSGAAVAIYVGHARTTIVNDGRIFGDVTLGDAADRVDTSGGRIAGTISTGGGNDVIFGGVHGEVANAGLGNDVIAGRSGEDTLNGGTGNDVVRGGAGDDNLVGDTGNDILFGNADDDVLSGGGDNDRLVGGRGDDVLAGGTGNDVFAFSRGSDHDVVTDFFGADRLDVQAFGLANFAAVRALAHQSGSGGTLLDFGHDDTVLLPAVRLANLNAGDFII